mgnify:FL=1
MSKPIDKTRPSNRRCRNCKHWEEVKENKRSWRIEDRKINCETGGHQMNYWNCCAYFEWNPEKEYKEALKDGKGD